jgi:hypothetical protein
MIVGKRYQYIPWRENMTAQSTTHKLYEIQGETLAHKLVDTTILADSADKRIVTAATSRVCSMKPAD